MSINKAVTPMTELSDLSSYSYIPQFHYIKVGFHGRFYYTDIHVCSPDEVITI